MFWMISRGLRTQNCIKLVKEKRRQFIDIYYSSWAKLVDGKVPCEVVIELALAFSTTRGVVKIGARPLASRRRIDRPSVTQARIFEQV
jgi:hypothetical protein